MYKTSKGGIFKGWRTAGMIALMSFALSSAQGVVSKAQGRAELPWMNTNLDPAQRATY